ncbi:SDR family NAD(P)-dependent oxidoreductase [Bdellovibrio svalbardensis]|uniref:SDR family NAD(P)-dependent oxidoreductase n=1 Tax=Bdellovibrio svalbardensis TaxID=2972972 RepID=A0ABT6DEG8_9BACT|nr:SDR family NAD(P)-dependent oxidoreductase [Bdellovibrio svalbardensis]MDG0815235.1 SDR family NAD(P)-dependent oxidoreductase [Bdellovibrio svalbardensis]
MKKIAVVTGASRGLGYATSEALAQRGFKVVMAMRDPEKSQKQINAMKMKDLDVVAMKLDVSQEKSINEFAEAFRREYGYLDVLVNNAGIFIDDEDGGNKSVFKTKSSTIQKTFATNTLGPFLLTQKLFPLMQQEGSGRIVNVSSGMGQLSEMDGNYAAYRISKTALNVVTQVFAAEGKGHDILVNSICPGWVRTDMGGAGASRDINQGIKGILWAATLPKGGPTGGFFRDGDAIPW